MVLCHRNFPAETPSSPVLSTSSVFSFLLGLHSGSVESINFVFFPSLRSPFSTQFPCSTVSATWCFFFFFFFGSAVLLSVIVSHATLHSTDLSAFFFFFFFLVTVSSVESLVSSTVLASLTDVLVASLVSLSLTVSSGTTSC